MRNTYIKGMALEISSINTKAFHCVNISYFVGSRIIRWSHSISKNAMWFFCFQKVPFVVYNFTGRGKCSLNS